MFSPSPPSLATAPPASSKTEDAAPAVKLPPPRETVYVLTTPGPTRVTIVGDRGKTSSNANGDGGNEEAGGGGGGGGRGTSAGARRISVLTLHAAGHNYRTCFAGLEREVAEDEDLGVGRGGVVFYHVDTPGHEEEADGIE